LDSRTDFLFRGRDVVLTMNSVKILHAVRSAITAIAELLVNYPLLSQERAKLRTSIFVRTFLVSIGTKAHYKFREK